MDTELCQRVIAEVIELFGEPEIISTNQGSQYTSTIFTDYISKLYPTKLSMDGKGRVTDHAQIERFWRGMKYEHIYLNPTSNSAILQGN